MTGNEGSASARRADAVWRRGGVCRRVGSGPAGRSPFVQGVNSSRTSTGAGGRRPLLCLRAASLDRPAGGGGRSCGSAHCGRAIQERPFCSGELAASVGRGVAWVLGGAQQAGHSRGDHSYVRGRDGGLEGALRVGDAVGTSCGFNNAMRSENLSKARRQICLDTVRKGQTALSGLFWAGKGTGGLERHDAMVRVDRAWRHPNRASRALGVGAARRYHVAVQERAVSRAPGRRRYAASRSEIGHGPSDRPRARSPLDRGRSLTGGGVFADALAASGFGDWIF